MKTAIIGAGMTGLILAKRLQETIPTSNGAPGDIRIFEKSRAVGGRMATRRTEHAKFDHGAQFYARREPLEKFHQQWSTNSLTQYWFDRQATAHFCAGAGLTSLAKALADGLSLESEQRLISLQPADSHWRLLFESGSHADYDRVVITAPLPQCLEILRRSGQSYDSALDEIQYSKALVALIEVQTVSHALSGETGYREFSQGAIFSIADQMRKGVSKVPAYTVTLSATISESLFDTPDENVTQIVQNELHVLDPSLAIQSIQIKRWRFNQPLTRYGSLYYEATPSLFLAGDAFGGASLNGAARSAGALADRLAR